MFGILSHFAPLRNKICSLAPIFPILKPTVFSPVKLTPSLQEIARPTCRPHAQSGAQDIDRSPARWDDVGSYAESVAGSILNPNFNPQTPASGGTRRARLPATLREAPPQRTAGRGVRNVSRETFVRVETARPGPEPRPIRRASAPLPPYFARGWAWRYSSRM